MSVSPRTLAFVTVLAVSVLMRLGHFTSIDADPIANVLFLDCKAYDTQAMTWAEGGNPFEGPYFQAPIYPYLLSVVFRIFGHDYDFIRLLQMSLDVISAVLVWNVAYRIYGLLASWIAGLIIACYPVLIFESGLILKTTLSVFLFSLTLWILYVFPRRHRAVGLWLLGVSAGVSAINQGSFLLVIPLYFVWILLNRTRFLIGRCIVDCMLFGVGIAMAIAPVTFHNWRTSGELILLTTQGGANFYLGNSPYSDGTSKRPPRVRMTPEYEEADFHREAERAEGKRLTPREASAYWGREAWRWIHENPGDAFRLQLRKFGLFWNKVEIPDNHDFDFYRRYSVWIRYPRYPFMYLCLAALPGLVFAVRRYRQDWLIVALTVSYCLIVTAFHVYSRYRLPIVVPLSILAGLGVESIVTGIRLRRYAIVIAWLAVSAASGVLSNLPLTHYTHAQPLFNLGVGLMRLGKPDEAAIAFKDALKVTPEFSDALGNLGKIAFQRNDLDEAESLWRQAIGIAPESEEILSNLGTLAVRRGRLEDAEVFFRRSIEVQPYYFLGWLHLGQILQMTQKPREAIQAFLSALALDPNHPQCLYMYAQTLDQCGDPAAKQVWERYLAVARNNPEEAGYLSIAKSRLLEISRSAEGSRE